MEGVRTRLTVHAPQLDLPVICSGDNEGKGGVEGRPIDPSVMPLQDILHHRVSPAKEIRIHLHILLDKVPVTVSLHNAGPV